MRLQQVRFQYYNHVGDCSVQWANGTENCETTVYSTSCTLLNHFSTMWCASNRHQLYDCTSCLCPYTLVLDWTFVFLVPSSVVHLNNDWWMDWLMDPLMNWLMDSLMDPLVEIHWWIHWWIDWYTAASTDNTHDGKSYVSLDTVYSTLAATHVHCWLPPAGTWGWYSICMTWNIVNMYACKSVMYLETSSTGVKVSKKYVGGGEA